MITADCKTTMEIIITKNKLEGIGRPNSAWQVISMVDELSLELCDRLVDLDGCLTDWTKLLKDVILIQAIKFSDRRLVLPRSRPMFFEKTGLWMPRKLAKTVEIFVEIEHFKNWEVTFWPKRIRQLLCLIRKRVMYSSGSNAFFSMSANIYIYLRSQPSSGCHDTFKSATTKNFEQNSSCYEHVSKEEVWEQGVKAKNQRVFIPRIL